MRLEYRRLGDLSWKSVPREVIREAIQRAETIGHPNPRNPYLYINSVLAWIQILLGGDGVLIRVA